mgnify:CR=1 FL=1
MLLVRKWSNEAGIVIIALPMIILLMVILVSVVRLSHCSVSTNVILKNTTTIAVKGAVNQLDEAGCIDFEKARMVFEELLKNNMELGDNLEPQTGSAFTDKVEYGLLIYNGQQTEAYPSGIQYVYKNGVLTRTEIDLEGFPQTCYIPGGIEANFNSPGVMAMIEAEPKGIFGKGKPCKKYAEAETANRQPSV